MGAADGTAARGAGNPPRPAGTAWNDGVLADDHEKRDGQQTVRGE